MICYSSHRKVIHYLLKQVRLEEKDGDLFFCIIHTIFKILPEANSALDLTTKDLQGEGRGETEKERLDQNAGFYHRVAKLASKFAFLMSSLVLLMLLVQEPHFEHHWSRE